MSAWDLMTNYLERVAFEESGVPLNQGLDLRAISRTILITMEGFGVQAVVLFE